MQKGDRIVLLPAIKPDVALFHVPLADRFGNAWIGSARELMTIAHASHKTLITAEKVVDFDLMADPKMMPACIPAHYVFGIVEAKLGSWPIGVSGHLSTDHQAMERYASLAKTKTGFDEFITKNFAHEAAE